MMIATDKKIRVRFPPSPTGHWHLGGARTALFNWLFARKYSGEFILRIEDTDKERSDQKYEIEIVEAMKWLGLTWDEGPDWQMVNHKWQSTSRGSHGPYRQSERTDIYRKYLEKLIKEKRAYYCYCSKEDLEAEKQSLVAEGLPPKYSGHCRNLTSPPAGREPQLIRFRTPEVEVEFKDLIRGNVKFDASLFGDVVIAKDLNSPLYNFAVMIDDYEMRITHIIRGEDHISNTPKQILMARALDFPEPIFGHLPLILAPNRSKLSKRFAEVSIFQYRDEGYLPEAVINFLALLGWHPSGNQEIFSLQELVEAFNIKRVQKAGAVFDREKLDWLNAQYLRKLSKPELNQRTLAYLKEHNIDVDKTMVKKLLEVELERMKTLGDFPRLTNFFFKLPDYKPALLVWKTDSPAKTRQVLEELLAILEPLDAKQFNQKESINSALEEIINAHSKGSVLWPLRVAVSGQAASPDPLSIVQILGKDETLNRLRIALNKIGLAI